MWDEKWLQHPETHVLFTFKETFKHKAPGLLLKAGTGRSHPDSQTCLGTYICLNSSAASASEPLSELRCVSSLWCSNCSRITELGNWHLGTEMSAFSCDLPQLFARKRVLLWKQFLYFCSTKEKTYSTLRKKTLNKKPWHIWNADKVRSNNLLGCYWVIPSFVLQTVLLSSFLSAFLL